MKIKDFRGDILLVDDTPANLRLLSSILQERGFKTRAVVNGTMALTAAHTAPPDLILLDITMPDMSGYEVCEKLKLDELTRDIPIIFISALDATEDKIKAFTTGGVDYITKPFQIEEVMARVQTHLALRAMQRSLQKVNTELRQLSQGIEQSPASVVITDLKGNITYVNPQFSALTGYSFEEALGQNPRILQSGQTPGEVYQGMWQVITSGKVWKGEFQNKKKNEELYWEEATIGPVLDHDGQIINFVAVKIDITERKRAEENLVRMNRILAMLSASKQALMRANDEIALLNEICKICVELGGYRMAWVGVAEEDEAKTVRPIAHRGFEDGYLDKVKISWADVDTGRGPTGLSIRTRQPAIARNIPTETQYAPWRSDAIKRGYASSSSFPLFIRDRVFGALCMYAAAPDAFNQQEIDLLTELAENISYGLDTLQTRAARKRMEEALQRSETLFRAITEQSGEGIALLDNDGDFVIVNPAFCQMTGYSEAELITMKVYDLRPAKSEPSLFLKVRSGQSAKSEVDLKKKDGALFWAEISADPIQLADQNMILGVIRDITERKRMEAELERLATTDPLTNLLNRRELLRRAEAELERARRYEHPTSAIMLDVDYFKKVNDTCGHTAGDKVLIALAQLLTREVRTSDLVARYGGEEFMLLLSETSLEQARAIAERIRCAVADIAVVVDDQTIRFTISLGVTSSDKSGLDFESLLKEADRLLYQAKQSGRNRVVCDCKE